MNDKAHDKRGWRIEVRGPYGDFDDRETAERMFHTLVRSGQFADGSRLVLLGPNELAR